MWDEEERKRPEVTDQDGHRDNGSVGTIWKGCTRCGLGNRNWKERIAVVARRKRLSDGGDVLVENLIRGFPGEKKQN